MGQPTSESRLQRIATILLAQPGDTISRVSLRAMLPVGRTRQCGLSQHLKKRRNGTGSGRINVETRKFQDVLYALERKGCIRRSETSITIVNRDKLRRLVTTEEPPPQASKR